eukprot:scaffold743_cov106-Isochrysis_galbana.AAC.3
MGSGRRALSGSGEHGGPVEGLNDDGRPKGGGGGRLGEAESIVERKRKTHKTAPFGPIHTLVHTLVHTARVARRGMRAGTALPRAGATGGTGLAPVSRHARLKRGGDLGVSRRLRRPLRLVLAPVFLDHLHDVVVAAFWLGGCGRHRGRRRLRQRSVLGVSVGQLLLALVHLRLEPLLRGPSTGSVSECAGGGGPAVCMRTCSSSVGGACAFCLGMACWPGCMYGDDPGVPCM